MVAVLKIRDEYFGTSPGSVVDVPSLRLASERTSAREIIRQRVLSEVEDLNARFLNSKTEPRRTRSFIVDVQPISPEARLNRTVRPNPNEPQVLAFEVELERALTAFSRHRFVMLFDGNQVEELDQELAVTSDSEMIFLHLTPLRGG